MWHGDHVLQLSLSLQARKPLPCLVTLLLASSLSLIRLCIVSSDVMQIRTVGTCSFDAFRRVFAGHVQSPPFSPAPLVLLCVFYATYAHLRATVYLCLSAVFDSILWGCGLFEFTMPSIPMVCNIWECGRKSLGHACDSIRTPPWTKA